MTDVSEVDSGADLVDACPECMLGSANHLFDGGAGFADDSSESGVSVVAFVFDNEIERNFVAVLECVVGVGGAVDEFVIDGDADGARKRWVEFVVGGFGAAGDDFATNPGVKFALGHADIDVVAEIGKELSQNCATLAHSGNFFLFHKVNYNTFWKIQKTYCLRV